MANLGQTYIKEGHVYTVSRIQNGWVTLSSNSNYKCDQFISVENFAKLNPAHIGEAPRKGKQTTFEFNGDVYNVTVDGIDVTDNNTGKKIVGIWLRGTKRTGKTQISHLAFNVKGEFRTQSRYAEGKNGFMYLLEIITYT